MTLPILDTRTYEAKFPDGEVSEYAANIIAENMWAQCDLEGKQHIIMDSIMIPHVDLSDRTNGSEKEHSNTVDAHVTQLR